MREMLIYSDGKYRAMTYALMSNQVTIFVFLRSPPAIYRIYHIFISSTPPSFVTTRADTGFEDDVHAALVKQMVKLLLDPEW